MERIFNDKVTVMGLHQKLDSVFGFEKKTITLENVEVEEYHNVYDFEIMLFQNCDQVDEQIFYYRIKVYTSKDDLLVRDAIMFEDCEPLEVDAPYNIRLQNQMIRYNEFLYDNRRKKDVHKDLRFEKPTRC